MVFFILPDFFLEFFKNVFVLLLFFTGNKLYLD